MRRLLLLEIAYCLIITYACSITSPLPLVPHHFDWQVGPSFYWCSPSTHLWCAHAIDQWLASPFACNMLPCFQIPQSECPWMSLRSFHPCQIRCSRSSGALWRMAACHMKLGLKGMKGAGCCSFLLNKWDMSQSKKIFEDGTPLPEKLRSDMGIPFFIMYILTTMSLGIFLFQQNWMGHRRAPR